MPSMGAPRSARPGTVTRGVRMLREQVGMHPRVFAVAVAGAAVYGVATVASSRALRWTIDNAVLPRFRTGHVAVGTVVAGAVAIVAIGLVRAVGVVFRRSWAGRTQWSVISTLRRGLAHRYLEQPPAWHNRQVAGELVAHVGVDAEAATDALGPLPFATGVVVLLGTATVVLLTTDWVLGGAAVVLFPVISGLNVWYQHRVTAPAEAAQEQVGELAARVHESFDGALLVKALGQEQREVARVAASAEALRKAKVRTATMRADFEALLDGLPALANVLLLAIGARRVQSGALSVGDVTGFLYLYGLLVWPLRTIGFVLGDLPRSLAGWDRLQALLAQPVAADPALALVSPAPGYAVELRDVHLAYEPGRDVLAGVDLRVREGTTVAVVGRTGAGKTTLVHVLAGLLAPDRGDVAVQPGARRLAFQEAFLFAGSLADNVSLWRPLAAGEPARSLRLAAADFVAELPAGAQTVVGERGVSLSGGQRQRIAVARALAAEPRLLLLDDVTSALDPTTEALVLRNLGDELRGVTTVLVASRPSTIALADEVVYLDEGRVVDQGCHDDLFARHAGYRELVEAYARERADGGDGTVAVAPLTIEAVTDRG